MRCLEFYGRVVGKIEGVRGNKGIVRRVIEWINFGLEIEVLNGFCCIYSRFFVFLVFVFLELINNGFKIFLILLVINSYNFFISNFVY